MEHSSFIIHHLSFLKKVKDYFSLVKISHTIFALPFALLSFVLGITDEPNTFKWQILLYVVLCMFFARNAAMGFNRYADRKIDALNPRTAKREIPAGIISGKSALLFVIINVILFEFFCWLISPLCLYLSPLALLVILGYSLTKRFTFLCHLILGCGLSIAVGGAYIAATGTLRVTPVILALAVVCWTAGFDVIYALQDESFDKSNNLFSIPAKFGIRNALYISSCLHFIVFVLLCIFSIRVPFSYLGWIGFLIFTSLLLYQHLIVKPNDLSRVNAAFAITNGVASLLFAFFGILNLLLCLC